NMQLASGSVQITSSVGTIVTQSIDVSAAGGVCCVGNALPSHNAGTITLTAASDIQTGYLRAYGAGGTGNLNSNCCGVGGAGGAGGAVSLQSGGGNVLVNGDINTSGGGGGGSGYASGPGGAGGNAGAVTISTPGDVSIAGPVLAVGGGGGGGS